jgi:sulfate permease, SulP family
MDTGFLFFGTIAGVEETIRGLVAPSAWARAPVRFVVLDLALVAGVDMSAAEAFVRVQRVLAERGVILCFAGASRGGPVGKAIESVGLLEMPGVEMFESVNEAMEWTENAYLRSWEGVMRKEGTAEPIGGWAFSQARKRD